MASFNGTDLGLVLDFATEAEECERQMNAYPDVDGIEVVNLGSRGGITRVNCVLGATDIITLATLRQTFRNYQQLGGSAVFIDGDGTIFENVILFRFRPGRRSLLAGGGVCQVCEFEFLHPDPV